MDRPDLQQVAFDETARERLIALEGNHVVRYDGVEWRVTVTTVLNRCLAFTLTPKGFAFIKRSQVGFFYYFGTEQVTFSSGEEQGISFVQAFLNGYEIV